RWTSCILGKLLPTSAREDVYLLQRNPLFWVLIIYPSGSLAHAMIDIEWPNEAPPDCPFPRSTALSRIVFSGRSATYTDADTWYPSWAADCDLYSPWTDGVVHGLACLSFQLRQVNKYLFDLDPDAPASTGQAWIVAD